jgi:hypothetical protein
LAVESALPRDRDDDLRPHPGRAFSADPIALAEQLEAVATRTDGLDAATGRLEAWLRERVAPTG